MIKSHQSRTRTTYFWGQSRSEVLRALADFIEEIEGNPNEFDENLDDFILGDFDEMIPHKLESGAYLPIEPDRYDQLVYGVCVTF